MTRTTHTYAILQVSRAAYDEIQQRLQEAGCYDRVPQGDEGELIDMQGIAVQAFEED